MVDRYVLYRDVVQLIQHQFRPSIQILSEYYRYLVGDGDYDPRDDCAEPIFRHLDFRPHLNLLTKSYWVSGAHALSDQFSLSRLIQLRHPVQLVERAQVACRQFVVFAQAPRRRLQVKLIDLLLGVLVTLGNSYH